MSQQRKTDLFRFVTFRSPESLTIKRKKLGFFSQSSESTFLRTTSAPNFETRVANASTFTAFQSVEQVKTLSGDFWDFARWLDSNKNSLGYQAVKKMVPLIAMDSDKEDLLWDNLYNSILTKASPEIRQAVLEVLVANNFIREHKEYVVPRTDFNFDKDIESESIDLRRLAKSKVIIPKDLLPPRASTGNTTESIPAPRNIRQAAQMEAKIAGEQLTTLRAIEKELGCFDKQYQTDYSAALKAAQIEYEKQVETVIAKYLRDNPKLEVKEGFEYTLPENLVPLFRFEFNLPFSAEYSKSKLSTDALKYVQDHCLLDQSVKSVLDHLRETITKTAQKASGSTRKRSKEVLINGVLTRPSSSEPLEFTLQPKKATTDLKSTTENYSFYFLLNTGYNGGFFQTADFRLTIGGKTYADKTAVIGSSKDGAVFSELFKSTPVAMPDGMSYRFEANVTLDNGKSYRIDKSGPGKNEGVSGVAILIGVGTVPENCGVTKIGIAEFRRVEQELCCYIPGEVSHIENVLAKEYKERSTRNLTKTETVFETSTEREMEDLTDTTSATKHELSSEVAEVIERDRESNYGFSAGVNGKYGDAFSYSANASGDFSFGQSSSDSNTIAKTYAEDVTRRALERIVQKTATKRTSRIIREFEENNKHGYDNRNGEQHVTGVFRWVDKVYKNRIVNYGTRMIYEFMVPEPARFYKQAVLIQAEEESASAVVESGGAGSTSVAVKPTSPAEYGIRDAASITRDNYANFASLYGISLDAPLDELVNVPNTYSQSYGNTDQPKSFSDNNLRVPDNYQCFQINGTASYNYKARVGDKAYIKVGIASKNWEHTELRGEGNNTEPFSHSLNNIEGTIAASINTKKIPSFTVSVEVKCRLKSSIFEQWQQTAYADIVRAYESQLQAFNEAQAVTAAAGEAGKDETEEKSINSNPLYNAEVVKTELKRLCIEMLMKPFGLKQGKDFYKNGECDVPELQSCSGLEEYATQVKFFELAFDWDLMYQKFFPYYWAKRCDWKSLFQAQDGSDLHFQAFLQSGMARVVVPVRQGYEDAVVFYMSSGQIWNGIGLVSDSEDVYMSIMDDLLQEPGIVEGSEWEVTVPSTLTIVQARSALLNEEGLPCCEVTNAGELGIINPIEPNSNTLKWKE